MRLLLVCLGTTRISRVTDPEEGERVQDSNVAAGCSYQVICNCMFALANTVDWTRTPHRMVGGRSTRHANSWFNSNRRCPAGLSAVILQDVCTGRMARPLVLLGLFVSHTRNTKSSIFPRSPRRLEISRSQTISTFPRPLPHRQRTSATRALAVAEKGGVLAVFFSRDSSRFGCAAQCQHRDAGWKAHRGRQLCCTRHLK